MLKKLSLITALAFLFTVGTYATDVSAKAAVLIEAESGRVLFEKNPDSRLPMASTTKIMTALVALESGDLERNVTVAGEAEGVEGSSVYLHKGDRTTLIDLLYALMLQSANDAAVAIAVDVGGTQDRFVEMMNEKSRMLGLSDTHFDNPNGLDSKTHYTTANDLARLCAYAMKNELFREIVSTKVYDITLNEKLVRVVNHNKLLWRLDGACGVKTGYTKASGRCLVSSVERNGKTYIAVTLNAPDDWSDHKKLYETALR